MTDFHHDHRRKVRLSTSNLYKSFVWSDYSLSLLFCPFIHLTVLTLLEKYTRPSHDIGKSVVSKAKHFHCAVLGITSLFHFDSQNFFADRVLMLQKELMGLWWDPGCCVNSQVEIKHQQPLAKYLSSSFSWAAQPRERLGTHAAILGATMIQQSDFCDTLLWRA